MLRRVPVPLRLAALSSPGVCEVHARGTKTAFFALFDCRLISVRESEMADLPVLALTGFGSFPVWASTNSASDACSRALALGARPGAGWMAHGLECSACVDGSNRSPRRFTTDAPTCSARKLPSLPVFANSL